MKYYIDFDVIASSYDLEEEYGTTVTYVFTEDLDDIVHFLYEQEFKIPYNELNWYLQPGAKEFVKDIEEKWLKNQIDCSKFINTYEFRKWVAFNKLSEKEIANAIEDEVISDLNHLSKDELRDIQDDLIGDLFIEIEIPQVGYKHSISVELPEVEEDDD